MSRDILRGAEPPSTARDMRRDHRRGRGPTCVTVAVRPAADEPLPEVYTHVGAACAELHQILPELHGVRSGSGKLCERSGQIAADRWRSREMRRGAHLLDELEELRFGDRRVAEQQHVDVAAQARAVGELLTRAREEQACDRLGRFAEIAPRLSRDASRAARPSRRASSSISRRDLA